MTSATDYLNKFNRIIFYSPVKIPDNYAIKIRFIKQYIKCFNTEVEIKIINNYDIFIKPSEINNLYKIFGIDKRVSCQANEYNYFIKLLKLKHWTLNDIVRLSDEQFYSIKDENMIFNTHNILELLEMIRDIVFKQKEGHNVLKYLIYVLRNSILIDQISSEPCANLSNLYLKWGCIVFETMPYASSLNNHRVSIGDLFEIIDTENREHEFFGRKIQDLSDSTNKIYFSFEEIGYDENECKKLIDAYNEKIYYKHTNRYLDMKNKKVYIKGYEESTIKIINILKAKSKETNNEYQKMYDLFEIFSDYKFTDDTKRNIARKVFINSNMGLIYGSAGTGKTEMIKIMSEIFEGKKLHF